MKIHQVYWSFDGSDMNDLFKECSLKIKEFSQEHGHKYKLWNERNCETLIKKYPQYEELYHSVRYPIMKVDIIRFLILHKEGGIYFDMDIKPSVKELKDAPFIVSVYHDKGKVMYNMEVLQSKKGNEFCLDYLNYVKSQVEEKDAIDIYNTWKSRYVLQTTGPKCLSRFIKKNKLCLETYNVNNSTTNPNKMNLEFNEDFISYPSGSWIL